MKKRMQMISCITAAMLISFAAAGCSQKDNSAAETAGVQTEAQTSEPQISETNPEDDDQIHLKWALWSADSQPYWQPIADAYMEQNPNVTIELVDLGVTDYVTALSTQMAGDERPYDVVAIKDLAQYTSMIQKGLLKPLDESKIDADLYNGNLDLYKWEGQCYTLPLRSDFYAIFYNKDLFDAAGVTYPTNDMTFEEFDEIARKMTNTTFGSEVYGVHYHPAWSQLYNGFGILEGRHNVMDGNYEYMKPAYEMVLKQQEDGVCMDYATAKTSGVNYLAAFGAADVAMFPSGSWCVGTLINRIKEGQYPDLKNWGMVEYPHAEGESSGPTFSSFTGVSAVKGSPYEEEAEAFVRFAAGEESAEIVSSFGYFPGAMTDSVADTILSVEGVPQDDASKEALTSPKELIFDSPFGENASEVQQILTAGNDYIMTGTMTVDEGIAYMNEEIEKLK